MTTTSPVQLGLNVDNQKKVQYRKGSLLNLFNFSSNESISETTDVDIQLFDGTKMKALVDVCFL